MAEDMVEQLPPHPAVCPECGQTLHLRHLYLGRLLICAYCEEILQIITLDPLQLYWAFEEPTHPEPHYQPQP